MSITGVLTRCLALVLVAMGFSSCPPSEPDGIEILVVNYSSNNWISIRAAHPMVEVPADPPIAPFSVQSVRVPASFAGLSQLGLRSDLNNRTISLEPGDIFIGLGGGRDVLVINLPQGGPSESFWFKSTT